MGEENYSALKDERNVQIIYNIYGGQVNFASDNGKIDAVHYEAELKNAKEQQAKEETDYIVGRCQEINRYFVKTEPYKEALDRLAGNDVILLVGVSGSGKSDSSIMLAKEYGDEYTFRYLRGSDSETVPIEDLMKSEYSQKEIIVFDDFLGVTKLNAGATHLNQVNELIKYVTQNSNKKLILNSRKTILEDAKIMNAGFSAYVENEIDIIDISRFGNLEERAEVLVKYVKEYNMGGRMEPIVKDENALRGILEHANYSPLIVKRVLVSCSKKPGKDLKETFFTMLDNPDSVWESEIKALNIYSRIYLNILYSISDTWVKQEYVDEAFDKYIEGKGIEYNETIQKTVQRLNSVLNFEKGRVTFIHPSLIDYLKKELSVQEKKEIILFATYFEQIERLDESKKSIAALYDDIERFASLKVLPYTYLYSPLEFVNFVGIKFLDYMVKLKVNVEEELVLTIVDEIFKFGRLLLLHSARIVLDVLLLDYDFSEITNNDSYMENLMDTLPYEDVGKLLEVTHTKSGDTFDFEALKPYAKKGVIRKLEEAAEEVLYEEIQIELPSYAEQYFENLEEGEEFYYADAAEEIMQEIWENIDIGNIVDEAKISLCEMYRLSNCEAALKEGSIAIEYEFVEDYIREYYGS